MRRTPLFALTLVLLSFSLAASSAPPIVKRYRWRDSHGNEWTWEVPIPRELYLDYKRRPRVYDNYALYVTDRENFYLLLSLAHALLSKAPYDHKGRLEFMAAFVQGAVSYVPDTRGEHPKYPVETLVKAGDCEDKAILLAAFLRAIGYRVALLYFAGNPGHMAVGVECRTCTGSFYRRDGVKYFYLEATAPDWAVGEVPPEYRGRPALVIVVR